MEIGIIGLGRMGGNMARRLLKHGHQVIGFNRNLALTKELEKDGLRGSYSLSEFVSLLSRPRAIWLMIPAGTPVDDMISLLLPMISKGDTIVDGGNSYYKDSIRRGKTLTGQGYNFVDVGTSGGIWGLEEGYSLMIGGEQEAVERLTPIFRSLAPNKDSGWGRVGPIGAGHFVKMVHNGIEYGMMEALAEGFSIMRAQKDFQLNLYQIAEIWRQGSVVRSWLLDLTARVLEKDQKLDQIAPFVSDSGEGRWAVAEAIEQDVPAPVITLSLIQRLRSRDSHSFSDRLLSAMRNQFGGHAVKTEKGHDT